MVGDRGQGGDQNGDPGLAENDPAGLSGQGGLHRVLGGCDLRCPFCHNGELVEGETPAALDDGELTTF